MHKCISADVGRHVLNQMQGHVLCNVTSAVQKRAFFLGPGLVSGAISLVHFLLHKHFDAFTLQPAERS